MRHYFFIYLLLASCGDTGTSRKTPNASPVYGNCQHLTGVQYQQCLDINSRGTGYYDNYSNNYGQTGRYPTGNSYYDPNYGNSGYPYYYDPYNPGMGGSTYNQSQYGYQPNYQSAGFPYVCQNGTMCGYDQGASYLPPSGSGAFGNPYGQTPYGGQFDNCFSSYGAHCANGGFYSGYLYQNQHAPCFPNQGYCFPTNQAAVEFNPSMTVPFF